VAGLARAGGETRVGHLLVLNDEVGQHALIGGDLAHGVEVDLAELLDVKRPAILVGLVVVLRVVGEDFGLLLVIEVVDQVVETTAEGRAPLLAVNEPVAYLVSVELFCVLIHISFAAHPSQDQSLAVSPPRPSLARNPFPSTIRPPIPDTTR
jgi:hypothetical protein